MKVTFDLVCYHLNSVTSVAILQLIALIIRVKILIFCPNASKSLKLSNVFVYYPALVLRS